jgi:hypothetical protein
MSYMLASPYFRQTFQATDAANWRLPAYKENDGLLEPLFILPDG